MYIIEYFSAIKKNEILLFATTWMDLKGIMLGEISQSEKENTVCYHLHMESKKTVRFNFCLHYLKFLKFLVHWFSQLSFYLFLIKSLCSENMD